MKHFTVNAPNVIHEIIEEEAVLVNLETGSYYSIDKVGAVIWEYIENGLSIDQILKTINQQYTGESEEIEQGVRAFLDHLVAEHLIVANDAAAEGNHSTSDQPANSQNLPFEVPLLNKYTDMEDLLLLDPIHDVDEAGWPNTNPGKGADAK